MDIVASRPLSDHAQQIRSRPGIRCRQPSSAAKARRAVEAASLPANRQEAVCRARRSLISCRLLTWCLPGRRWLLVDRVKSLKIGAPQWMKMGTTASPWRYDAAARRALQSVNLRQPAILCYATWEAASRFRGMSGYPSIAAVSVDPGIDAMCHEPTLVS